MSNQEGSPGANVAIEILNELKVKGTVNRQNQQPSIYKVPSLLRDSRPICFNPKLVSIGPLHKKQSILKQYEDQKASYIHDLLGSTTEQAFEECWQKLNNNIENIKGCYARSLMKSYTDDVELITMMVVDGFFILEFFRSFLDSSRNHAIKQSIFLDLLLLENQIPYFVLEDIFECSLKESIKKSLTCWLLSIIQRSNFFLPFGNNVTRTPDHILGLLHQSFHPKQKMISHVESSLKTQHSAFELDKAGVKFKPCKDDNWQMAIEYKSSWFASFCWWCWSNPTLKMPVLRISDVTEQFLRNIIAYEQCNPSVPNYISSYVRAMDSLVDTTDDLVKLVESKVITNMLGSNKDATKMINNLYKNVILKEFYYYEQWKKLDEYHNFFWPRNIAWFKRKYFSNPWTSIALLAGFLLFALTVVQTIFAIKAR